MAKMTYRKKKLFPLFAKADEERVIPILDALKVRGFPIADEKETPNKHGVMLLFTSERLNETPALSETFFANDARGVETVPVNLDGSTPPELLKNALYSRNTIFAGRYTVDELAERVATAKAFEVTKKPLPIILAAAAAALVIAGAVVLATKLLPTKETSTSETTLVPTAIPVVPGEAGLTAEDLEKVYELILMGDTLHYFTGTEGIAELNGWARIGAEYYAKRIEENGIAHWYSNEDGHEIELAAWNDLDFLRYMKNVKFITLVRVEGELPDLSGLSNLDVAELYDCNVSDLSGVSGSQIVAFQYQGNTITDFSPLNNCERLTDVHLEFQSPTPQDLSSFAPPVMTSLHLWGDGSDTVLNLDGLKQCPRLRDFAMADTANRDLGFLSESDALETVELRLPQLASLHGLENKRRLSHLFVDYQSENLRDMSALADNTSLKSADLHNEALSDLSWLSNAKNLQELELWNTKGVRNLHGLEEHDKLTRIHIVGLERLTDLTALETCTGLREINMSEVFALADISPIIKLPKLSNLQIYGSALNNVDFLWDVADKTGFSFGIAEVDDWSGLEAIKNYNYLNVTDRTGSALPYLKDATIRTFELWCRSGISDWSREALDWSLFPHVIQDLTLHGVVSLQGMPALPITGLFIDDSQTLTSLDGVENLEHAGDGMLWLNVRGCPRLTDWSALNGMKLAEICCENTFTLPNFASLQTSSVELNAPVDLFDLHCFDGINPNHSVSIELFQTMDVTDLSPLYALQNGDRLEVPAHLGEQAALLVESGNFRTYEVVYPDEWWEPAELDVTLLSLDELDTLPSAVLKRINQLNMVGDVIFSWDEYWLDQQWEWDEDTNTNVPTFVLRSTDGNEERDIVIENPGTITDFSKLAVLTGLEALSLHYQSFNSLEGAQNLENLWKLEVTFTPTLTDASAAFTLQELEELHLQYTGVTSLQGIQNLQKLRFADFNGLALDDLTPFGGIPEDCNFSFDFPLMTVEEFFALPDSVLSCVREIGLFGNYVTKDPWGDLWLEEDWDGGDKPTLYLHDNATGERTPIGEGQITDLGFLNRLPNLETLYLYGQPIETLDGVEAAGNLSRFDSRWTNISDLSPLFELEQLQIIGVENTETVTSIEGIQKLRHLTDLNIGGNNLTDISAIGEIDFTFCMEPDEDGNAPYFILGVDNLQGKIPDEQYAVLSAVPEYRSLNVFNTDCALWMDAVKHVKIHELHAGGCRFTNEMFKAFVEQHPELEYIKVSWTPELTDISPLLTLSDLRAACVSNNMQSAIRSLGDEYGFNLEME